MGDTFFECWCLVNNETDNLTDKLRNELIVFEKFGDEVEKEMEEWEEDNIDAEAINDQRRKTLTRRKSRKPEFDLLNIQTKINLATK